MQKKEELTPLAKHIRYLGGFNVWFGSMYMKNRSLGASWALAFKNAFIVAFGAGMKVKKCPFASFAPEEAVGVLNHAFSTHIYQLDGTINEEKWSELAANAEKNDKGVMVIYEKQFYLFLTKCREQETSNNNVALKASNAEWDFFFYLFADIDKLNNRFVPLTRFRDFYEDTEKVGQEIEARFANAMKKNASIGQVIRTGILIIGGITTTIYFMYDTVTSSYEMGKTFSPGIAIQNSWELVAGTLGTVSAIGASCIPFPPLVPARAEFKNGLKSIYGFFFKQPENRPSNDKLGLTMHSHNI